MLQGYSEHKVDVWWGVFSGKYKLLINEQKVLKALDKVKRFDVNNDGELVLTDNANSEIFLLKKKK